MPVLRLLLDPEGSAVDVDDAMRIGACAAQLAAQLGYPPADDAGMPVCYRLCPSAGGAPLPNDQRFRDLRLGQQTRLRLTAPLASALTSPVSAPAIFDSSQTTRLSRAWSRRGFLATGAVAAFGLAGLGSGLALALVQRSLSRRMSAAIASISPTGPTTGAPRSATPALTFASHQQIVRVLGWSPDGRLLASGGDDAQLLVWGTDGTIRQSATHPAAVTALAWSPESARVVTGAASQVMFLSVPSGQVLARSKHDHTATVTGLAWTGHNQQQVVSGALDRRAIVWETATYHAQTVFTRHTAPIESVTWAADGQTVASSSHGGVVRVWDAEDGQEAHPYFQDAPLAMRAAAFAPSGTQLAIGGDDGVVRLWNGQQCQLTGAGNGTPICLDIPRRLSSSRRAIRALAWSPDARYLASSGDDGSFSLWDPAQGHEPLFTMELQPGNPVLGLAWSPDGLQLATASGKTVVVWDLHRRG